MIMYRFTVLLEILGGNISYCFVAARNSSLSFCIQGACMVRGAWMVKRGMLDKGGHAGKGKCVAKGIMCGKGVCMVKGGVHRGHAWQGLCKVGACIVGGMHGGGLHGGEGGMHGKRDGHCSGRYASYWNAFLFPICLEEGNTFCQCSK